MWSVLSDWLLALQMCIAVAPVIRIVGLADIATLSECGGPAHPAARYVSAGSLFLFSVALSSARTTPSLTMVVNLRRRDDREASVVYLHCALNAIRCALPVPWDETSLSSLRSICSSCCSGGVCRSTACNSLIAADGVTGCGSLGCSCHMGRSLLSVTLTCLDYPMNLLVLHQLWRIETTFKDVDI